VGYTAEAGVVFTALRLAVGFAVRRQAWVGFAAVATLLDEVVNDLPVAAIATVEA
jgi:hypothetical protein